MATSLNGWTAIRLRVDPRLRTITVPGTKRKITCARYAHVVFASFLSDWNRLMPARLKLDTGPVDSWIYREARLATGLSNHSSGTAVDVRYDILKADNQRHMTDAERGILKAILARYVTDDGHHILANGAFWKSCDEMHTELSQAWDTANGAKRNTTQADVLNVIQRLGIDSKGNRVAR